MCFVLLLRFIHTLVPEEAHTVLLQGHKSTREVHFANWIVPLLSASNDSPVIATMPASFIPPSFLKVFALCCCSFSEYAIW